MRPGSAFGGVIAVNRPVTVELAEQVAEIFTEVIVAPVLRGRRGRDPPRKKNLRVLLAPAWPPAAVEFRQISGGVLAQLRDRIDAPGDDPANWTLATGRRPRPRRWPISRSPGGRSGGEVQRDPARRDGATVGVGMGQVNRVDSARLAVSRAGERAEGRWRPPTPSSRSPTASRS